MFIRPVILFVITAISSIKLHKKMLNSTLASAYSFFMENQIGINAFKKRYQLNDHKILNFILSILKRKHNE